MALTRQQKNIVNPTARTFRDGPEDNPVRSGIDYSYEDPRNRFVLDVLHESYLSYYEFPPEGFQLFPDVGPDDEARESSLQDLTPIARADLLAYTALYRQNGKVMGEEGQGEIVALTEEQTTAQLNSLKNVVEGSDNHLANYFTDTAPLSFDPDNSAQRYKLVCIEQNHSAEYVSMLRDALGKADVPPLDATPSLDNTILPPEITGFVSSDSNVDLTDWKENCHPGAETVKTYYNSRDKRFYYTERSNRTEPYFYDALYYEELAATVAEGEWEGAIQEAGKLWETIRDGFPSPDEYEEEEAGLVQTQEELVRVQGMLKDNIEKAMNRGVKGILQATGKWSVANQAAILGTSPKQAYFVSHLDIRPGARWIFAVQVPQTVLDQLPDSRSISFEEQEMTPLQKAEVLADPEKTSIAHSQTFIFDDLLDYLYSTRRMLEAYNEDMAEEGIYSLTLMSASDSDPSPSDRSGRLFLEDEMARLAGMADFLPVFFAYNKRTIGPDSVIELFFDAKYQLLHICGNGELLTRGLGNINYINPREDLEHGTVLNAFAMMTPTSYSYVLNSRKIHEQFLTNSPESQNREEWTIFLPKYTYPEVDINPESIKKANEEESLLRKRKKLLFQRISQVLDVPPAEAKLLYERKMNDPKWVRMRVTELVKGVNCDTAQAQIANHIVGFWNAFNDKHNVRAVIRETILLLRSELAQDVATHVGVGEQYQKLGANPLIGAAERLGTRLDLSPSQQPGKGLSDKINAAWANENNRTVILREVNSAIDSQIRCALDTLGDFLQDGFLDPMGAPPAANKLVRREMNSAVTVKIPKMKMISIKKDQSEYYWKIVDQIIQQLIKSLVAGIAKDVFEAALGCGPNDNQAEQLANSLKKYDFGFSQLSQHIQGVDLRDIALRTGLVTLRHELIDGVKQVVEEIPPTHEQMTALLKDVSTMCTPAELQQLLFGEAENVLYELLYETLSDGTVRVKTGETPNNQGVLLPDYYFIKPSVYMSLNITKDIIRDFFTEIGNAMLPDDIDSVDGILFQSPLEAYCDGKDPDIDPLRLKISLDQLQSQYIQVMDARIEKINWLCEWLQNLTQIEKTIQDMLDFIPIMDWYNDILQILADVSNWLADWIAWFFKDKFDRDPPHSSADVDNIYTTEMGSELFFQIRDNLKEYNWHQLINVNSDKRPYMEDDIGFLDNDLSDATFYVLGGELGYRYPGQALGLPYITPENKISYTIRDARINQFKQNLKNAQDGRRPMYGYFFLPYTQPSSIDTDPSALHPTRDIGEYAMRTAPWGYREALHGGFAGGNPPGGGKSPTDASAAKGEYGLKVQKKISNSAWENIPYTGFVSPIYLSSKSMTKGGYDIYGIKVGIQKPFYEKLAHWTPGLSSWEGGSFAAGETATRNVGTNAIMSYGMAYAGREDDNSYQPLMLGVKLPPLNNIHVQLLVSEFFSGHPGDSRGGGVLNYRPYEPEDGEENEENIHPELSIMSPQFPEQHINNAYYSATGKRRMPQYVNAINRDVLKVLDDKCVSKDDIKKAKAIVKVVQARMQGFFLNIMPLGSSWPHWNDLATRKLVCNYLTTKVIESIQERSLMGLIYQNLDIVKKVYADESENDFSFEEDNLPQENLGILVETMYIGMLNNIAKYTEYDAVNTTSYTYYSADYREKTGRHNVTVDRYDLILRAFFKRMALDLELSRTLDYGLETAEEKQEVIDFINNTVLLPDNTKTIGHYYFPLGPLIATQLIYYDYSMNTSGRYSQTNYRLQLEQAGADDGLLSAFRGVVTRQFSQPFRGFPQTVPAYTGDNEITYYNSIEVERRMAELQRLMGGEITLIEEFDAIRFSPSQFVNMTRAEFDERVAPAIWEVIDRDVFGSSWPWGYNRDRSINDTVHPEEGAGRIPFDQIRPLIEDQWYGMLTPGSGGGSSDYTGQINYQIFGDFDRDPFQHPEGSADRALADASSYLNIVSEQTPSLWTPAEYFEQWHNLWFEMRAHIQNNRVGQWSGRGVLPGTSVSSTYTEMVDAGTIPDDFTADDWAARIAKANQTALAHVMVDIYKRLVVEALVIENLREERNRLEKLIIE